MTGEAPRTWSTITTLAGITLMRTRRSRAFAIGVVIAALPVLLASVLRGVGETASADGVFVFSRLVLVMLPAMYVGASISDEIESRTITYLWSRPIARWAVLAGKLCALVPILILLMVPSWYAAAAIAEAETSPMNGLALALGCVAVSLTTMGITTVVPRFGMALSIGYMLADNVVGAIPFSLRAISVTYHIAELAQLGGHADPVWIGPAIGLVVLSSIWVAVALWRIRRLES